MLECVRQRADEFDFLHFHLDYYPFSLFPRHSTPYGTPASLYDILFGASRFDLE
jgi:hypothetical protein